jgi:beta-galactosidase/beta-glucuronidase
VIPSLLSHASNPNPRIELDNGWNILIDPSGRMQREDAAQSPAWRSARVGVSWNVQFHDLRDYMGAAWYRTEFSLPVFHDTRHVLLKFGAVDYFCEVFVNGTQVGTHEGGYTPFSFDITSAVRSGENDMYVRVVDPPMDEAENRELFPDMMYHEIPHGKQNWYVQISGIWQGVRLELCPSIYVERLDVIPEPTGSFELVARLAGVGLTAESGVLAAGIEFKVEIYDNGGRLMLDK